MNLIIDFPENMITDELLKHERIPCICMVSNKFEISFSVTVPESTGLVSGWDRTELDLRAVAGAGGQYTHYAQSLITLEKVDDGVYKIIDLEMFNRLFGWCAVLQGGEYAPPGDFWDQI
ncbi:hypothetical protein [Pseudomonas sp. COW5]|uniref:hypothetical protein n=1 Tax=Pseudomonas sp. COW5 TaxID=2981253 RepID=UPI002245E839|nr:hypothetical protein [Pseudomonas sp. COW5]MCX2546627.1 hypothetical protein [Pseudomonas sp. COW5]